MSVLLLNVGFEEIASNIGVSFELTVFLIVLLGNIIFYAKDFKIGTVLTFFTMGLLFMWFREAGLNFLYPLTVFLINVIIMAFTLFSMSKVADRQTIG